MSLREPDQVQLVLLALTEPSSRIAVGPELSLNDVFQAPDSHADSQDLGLPGASQERLVSFVGGELNPQLASGCEHVQRVRKVFGLEALISKMDRERSEV